MWCDVLIGIKIIRYTGSRQTESIVVVEVWRCYDLMGASVVIQRWQGSQTPSLQKGGYVSISHQCSEQERSVLLPLRSCLPTFP